jgi:lipoprotein NlpD
VTLPGAGRRGRGVSLVAARWCAPWLVAALVACTSASTVHNARRAASNVPIHVVQRGDTLYKIAWQYRVDQRDLVRWNGLGDPDVLRVGLRLRLVPPRGFVAPPPQAAAAAPRPAASAPSPPRGAQRPAAERAPVAPASRPPAASANAAWAWPTEGRLVTRFGVPGAVGSGIGIAGRAGQPVRAAAAGRVVYAGGGLIGYGQLVIIRHDDTFLSAYGYNSDLLVTQGQDVTRGATIALMGQGPERQPRLHFEIRRNGVPIDPLLFVQAPR